MRNIYCRLVKRSLGQTEEVWVLRGIVALFAVLCILFNLFVPGTIIEYFLIMLTFGSSLIWPVLFGLFREKFPWINGAGCFWGSILGFVTAFIWAIVFQNPFDLEPIFPTLTVSLISNIVISLMTRNIRNRNEKDERNSDVWNSNLRSRNNGERQVIHGQGRMDEKAAQCVMDGDEDGAYRVWPSSISEAGLDPVEMIEEGLPKASEAW